MTKLFGPVFVVSIFFFLGLMHHLRSFSIVFVGLILLVISQTSIQQDLPISRELVDSFGTDTLTNASSDTIRIRISSVGDIMAHQTQLTAQKQEDGTYNFENNFQYMQALFGSVDIMIGNLETTFAGEEKGYSAYPQFNTPDALAAAIKKSGINLVATANNHTYDNGGEAMLRTLDVLHENKLESIGTQKSIDEKNYVIREVKGVKIGLASYTYESGKNEQGLKTINGLAVSKAHEPLLNSFDPYEPTADLKKMQEVVRKMKSDSAEFVVFVVHWGKEYMQEPSKSQLEVAHALNTAGVDVIFGSHPHVVQPIDFLVNDSTDHVTFVAYSMGNFISNQRYESVKNYNTEDGLFVGVEFIKLGNQSPQLHKVFYEPTWVNRYKKSEKYIFEVVPARLACKSLDAYNIFNAATESRVSASNRRTINLVELPLSSDSEKYFARYLISHKSELAE